MNCADKAISTDRQFYPQVVVMSLSSLEKKHSGAGSLHNRRFFWIKNVPGFVTFKIFGFTGEHPSVNPRISFKYEVFTLDTGFKISGHKIKEKQIRYHRVSTLLGSFKFMTFHEFFDDLRLRCHFQKFSKLFLS